MKYAKRDRGIKTLQTCQMPAKSTMTIICCITKMITMHYFLNVTVIIYVVISQQPIGALKLVFRTSRPFPLHSEQSPYLSP